VISSTLSLRRLCFKQKKKNNKNKARIDEIGTNKTIQRINEIKSWFFEKINKIDKPLLNLTKMRMEKTQISKIRKKRERR
jgi:hypothetical protein